MSYRWSPGESIDTDKLNRTGQADIVLPEDSLEDIQERIDTISSEGGGTVLFKTGSYVFDDDLIVKRGVTLLAETFGQVSINFDNTPSSIRIEGELIYNTGTVSVTPGGTTVTGSSTEWDGEVTPGQKIWLSKTWYTVVAVGSDTSLTIATPYSGPPLSGASYEIAVPVDYVVLNGLTIVNTQTDGIIINRAEFCFQLNMVAQGCGASAMTVSKSNIIQTNEFFAVSCNTGFVFEENSQFIMRNMLALYTQFTEGMKIDNCADFGWLYGVISGGASDGILIKDTTNGTLDSVVGNANTNDGLKIENSGCVIANSQYQNNGGYGASVDDSLNNRISFNLTYFNQNVSGAINDNAHNTIINACRPKGINNDVVESNLRATATDNPSLFLKVGKGNAYFGNTLVEFAGGNSPEFTAPSSDPRIDVLSLDDNGDLVRTAGTEDSDPEAPAIPAGNIPIAQVFNEVGQTQINDTDLEDGNGYIMVDLRNFMKADFMGASVTRSSTTTSSPIPWNVILFDVEGFVAEIDTRIIIPQNGIYLVTANIVFRNSSTGRNQSATLRKNGSTTLAISSAAYEDTTSFSMGVSLSGIFQFQKGDYLEITTTTTGGTLTVQSAGNIFSIQRVG